jgi:hypothetical protein
MLFVLASQARCVTSTEDDLMNNGGRALEAALTSLKRTLQVLLVVPRPNPGTLVCETDTLDPAIAACIAVCTFCNYHQLGNNTAPDPFRVTFQSCGARSYFSSRTMLPKQQCAITDPPSSGYF